LVLFIILNLMMRKERFRNRPGFVTGSFFVFYGLARFSVEFVRQPDAQIGLILDFMSMGQILSLPMIVFGLGLMIYVARHDRKTA
jgi:phosphatidylglycerol:prolipoprotein diacylglycerol transferase